MKIFLDIDGVILDLESSFYSFVEINLKKKINKGTEDEWSWVWNNFLMSNFCEQLEPLIDVSLIRHLGISHEIILITGFPSEFCQKRIRNLKQIGLYYNDIHFVDSAWIFSKCNLIEKLINYSEIFIFVDDNFQICNYINDNIYGGIIYQVNDKTTCENISGVISASAQRIFAELIPLELDRHRN
ncbi:hypothetical protein [Methylobacter luteus]|uniref:hypothetical protein n=1 Tax=Methylobacter luteus TaxID=415 RepID=UPI0004835F55|nr:hypothetical protein [Methylobacter luteus]